MSQKQPNTTTGNGRKNLALLALMVDTAARVQEIDLTPESLKIESLFRKVDKSLKFVILTTKQG